MVLTSRWALGGVQATPLLMQIPASGLGKAADSPSIGATTAKDNLSFWPSATDMSLPRGSSWLSAQPWLGSAIVTSWGVSQRMDGLSVLHSDFPSPTPVCVCLQLSL